MNLENKHRRATVRPTGPGQWRLCSERPVREQGQAAPARPGLTFQALPSPRVGSQLRGPSCSLNSSGAQHGSPTAAREDSPWGQPVGTARGPLPRVPPAEVQASSAGITQHLLPTDLLHWNLRLLRNPHFNKAPGDFFPLKLKHNYSQAPLAPSLKVTLSCHPIVPNRRFETSVGLQTALLLRAPRGSHPSSAELPRSSGHRQGGEKC